MVKSTTDLSSVTTVGLDLAKHVFQVHAIDACGPISTGPWVRTRQAHQLKAGRRGPKPQHELGRGGAPPLIANPHGESSRAAPGDRSTQEEGLNFCLRVGSRNSPATRERSFLALFGPPGEHEQLG